MEKFLRTYKAIRVCQKTAAVYTAFFKERYEGCENDAFINSGISAGFMYSC